MAAARDREHDPVLFSFAFGVAIVALQNCTAAGHFVSRADHDVSIVATYIGPPLASFAMEANMNEELWRVQLSTGEIRMMTLDGLDRAFEDGLIDSRVPVLAPGASAWTTLGEAAGLDDDESTPATVEQSPSLSPVAIAPASSVSIPLAAQPSPESLLDLGLPDNFEELKPRRRGLVIGGLAAFAAAAVMLAVVVARLGASMPTATEVKAANATQAPPPAVETLPAPAKEAAEGAAKREAAKPELSDWQKRMLADADKARETQARGAKQEKEKEKADKARAQPRKPKVSGGLLNGGDRFDPLNGAL